ncbi:MAG: glycosyltransferase [Muribaculaceae bacterium]|nr:glycosyltransferase [Muribaculaceae bacterium]
MEVNNNILISICIPVYNREQYLNDCIQSIVSQDIDSAILEILFFDDASTDHSREIIGSFIDNNPQLNVKLLSTPQNKGLWNARNVLYDSAQGKYILCLDADDKFAPGILAKLRDIAVDNHPDMVIFPYTVIDTNGGIKRTVNPGYTEISSMDINNFPIDTYHFAIWNKLIRTDLIRDLDIKVPQGINCWEDLSVTARIYTIARNIVVLPHVGYYYRKHDSEAYTSHNHKNILEQHISCTEFITGWFGTNGLVNDYTAFFNHLKFATKIKMLRGDTFELKRWKKSYPETDKYIMSMPGIPLYYRVLFKILSLL